MAYSELIKNYEKIRSYMRDFYVYGFKSRSEYGSKSLRSYDDERRRIESWLGDYMRFSKTSEGKSVFISVDSRITKENPLYKSLKAKSFTDGDITLHFLIFDILFSPNVKKTLGDILKESDALLNSKMTFDESTVRKKLSEYEKEGIIKKEKQGRHMLYSRTESTDICSLSEAIDFFSEVAPCGVIGSFLQDKLPSHDNLFSFKHHYITQAIDSEVLTLIFQAIGEGCYITADNLGKGFKETRTLRLVPLKVFISAQNGRQNLMAYHEKAKRINSYRLDYLSNIKIQEPCASFSKLRATLNELEKYMWGVNCGLDVNRLEHVDFTIKIKADEGYIINRLEREKRCGTVEKLDEENYRFTAEVFDSWEMVPWIRTFISRITEINFSNKAAEKKFRYDIKAMYRMYGIEEEKENAV